MKLLRSFKYWFTKLFSIFNKKQTNRDIWQYIIKNCSTLDDMDNLSEIETIIHLKKIEFSVIIECDSDAKLDEALIGWQGTYTAPWGDLGYWLCT